MLFAFKHNTFVVRRGLCDPAFYLAEVAPNVCCKISLFEH